MTGDGSDKFGFSRNKMQLFIALALKTNIKITNKSKENTFYF